jgi:hypothetical protein
LAAENRRFARLFAPEGVRIRDFFLVRLPLLEIPGDFDDSGKTTV